MREIEEPRDYQIEMRIRNGRILGLMRRAGIPNASQLAEKAGTDAGRVGELLNLKRSPLGRNGEWLPIIHKIAAALNCLPDDMFSDQQRQTFMATNKKIISVSEEEVNLFLESAQERLRSPEDIVEESERRAAIDIALSKLTPREERILRRRFGLDGDVETLETLGAHFGVHKERLRQIEAAALRKLASPNVARQLLEHASARTRENALRK